MSVKSGFIVGFILLIILITAVSAADNETLTLANDESQVISTDLNEDTLTASNDYYFNASAESDGDGSINSPYKYLKSNRIKAHSNLYLADGEYRLDKSTSIEEVNIVGSNANKTILKYDGVIFNVYNTLTLRNLTILDATIVDYSKLSATNTIFSGGYGKSIDSYGNRFGGAIYCPDDAYTSLSVNINNCTFKDNYAEYGGAIYIYAGSLNIVDTVFIDNMAYNFGGAIAGEVGTLITISKSKFINSQSINDAGGAIYVKNCDLSMTNVEITNSSATFGGAVTSLLSDVTLNYLKTYNNTAKYDGGAIYHMYGDFASYYGDFKNNSAGNGGALFIDNSTKLHLKSNTFTQNSATYTAGAIYSICNKLVETHSVRQQNTFNSNTAFFKNDEYEVSSINLTIGSSNYTMYKNNVSDVDPIPSNYSLRDYNLITISKDQQASGNCWAFTALAVLESNILKAGGESLDLSEENMKNVIARFCDYGRDIDTNDGGYDTMPWGYLTSWLGPVLEMSDVFDDMSTLSPIFDSIMHVQNILFLKRDNFTDNDAIKKAIMKYGAVGTSMCYYNEYFKWDGYYCWASGLYSNHAVTIVGWDDNYSHNHFYGLSEGDGAWIVKNSWGPDWPTYNDGGYFYVSYYDAKLAQPGVDNIAYTFILNDTIRYDRNYQYDIAGSTDYYYENSDVIWYKNIFEATSDEYLSAVSTYFEKQTNWTLSVSINGEVKLIKDGMSNPGYYTIDLGELLPLFKGDSFEVEFRITGDGVVSIPISEMVSLNKLTYGPKTSFFSLDGVRWIDLYNHSATFGTHYYNSGVACIKAFTILNKINTTTFLEVFDDLIVVRVTDQYGNLMANANVTFNINGVDYIRLLSNGMAVLENPIFNRSINVITATFERTGYEKSSNQSTFIIPKTDVNITLDILKSLNNVEINFTSSIGLNESLNFTIGSKSYPVDFVNGKYSMNLKNLSNGIYKIGLLDEFELYDFNIINDEFEVEAYKTKIIASDFTTTENAGELFNITLMDENDSILKSKEIIFTISELQINNTTGEGGVCGCPIDLRKGDYKITVEFRGDDKYFKSSGEYKIKVMCDVIADINVESELNNALIYVNFSKAINETLTVIVNNKTYTVDCLNGEARLDLNNLSNGNYDVEVSLSDEYLFNQTKANFTVDVSKSIIDVSDLILADGGEFNITLLDEDNNPLANRSVEIVFDGADFNRTTDSNGVVSLPIDLGVGDYPIDIYFGGDVNHFKTSSSYTIKVIYDVNISLDVKRILNNVSIEITLSKAINAPLDVLVNNESYAVNSTEGKAFLELDNLSNADYDVVVSLGDNMAETSFSVNVSQTRIKSSDLLVIDSGEFNVTLLDDYDNPLSNMPLEITLNGITVNQTTDSNGQVSLPINLEVGEYPIEIYFAGNNDYFKTTSSYNINVINSLNITLKSKRTLNNVSLDISLSKEVNATLIINVGGESYFTNSVNGKASFTLNNLANGEYLIEIALDSDKYIAQNASAIVDINVKATEIVSEDIVLEEAGIFTITLTDENGVKLKNKEILFVLNNLSYVGITDANGMASIPVNLSRGNYTVHTYFAGDNDYLKSDSSNKISVVADFNITFNISNVLNDVVIDISLSKAVNESLIVNVGGKSYDVEVINGKASITLENLSNGRYSISVGLNDDTYQIESAFNLGVKSTEILSDDLVVFDDENREFTIVLIDENQNKLAGKEISFVLNGNTYTKTTDDNGEASLPIDLAHGQYEIDIFFSGDEKYVKSASSNKITVKTDVNITLSINQKLNDAVVNVDLSKRINATLRLSVNDEVYDFHIRGNFMALDLIDLDSGSYAVNAYILDDLYEHNKARLDFDIDVIKSKIISADALTYYHSLAEYKITLTDIEGNPLVNKSVQFKINGNAYFRKTNDRGEASFNLDLDEGEYYLSISFKGDNNYYKTSNVNKITVKSTVIAEDLLTKTYNSIYSFTLLDLGGNPLAGAEVLYVLNGDSFIAITDSNGVVNVNVTQKDGICTLEITNPLNGENVTRTIEVLDRITQNKDITIYAFSKSPFSVLVLDDNGNPVNAGEIVKFKLNKKTYSVKTDSRGIASLKISLKAKTYTITVEYKGFKVSNKVTIKPVLTAKNISKKKAKSYKFSAKLVNSKGKALKGKKITFKIKGKTYKAKTNKKGIATIKIKLKLKVGTYKIKSIYGKSKITNKIKIKK